MNMPLKLAIVASGRSQRYVAQRTGIGEVRLSAIVHGRVPATKDERKLLAKELGVPAARLFPASSVRTKRRVQVPA